ncbi:MAG: nucleotidyltransferase domain-containing protein [Chloroflexi bacterium]|nr:nucleotidyltransferase domain-containing protein [Chloroflexota bacterium]
MSSTSRVQVALDEIVRRIVAAYAPQKILLFGSHAYGQPDEDSDIDLLIIKETSEPFLARIAAVRRAIGSVGVPLDVFVLTPDEFEETKDVIGGLAYMPATYGRVVHALT